MVCYLLSIEEFMGQDSGSLLEEAFSKVDSHRRRKAEGLKPGRAQAACLGAGLALQLAVYEFLEQEEDGGDLEKYADRGLVQHTASGLLGLMRDKEPLMLAFRYGEKGKPYFQDYPLYFNLSHSGDYVICAISQEEVGADIQQHRAGAGGRIAARFFSEQETAALENSKEGGDALFFRLWARKEAYGKLTGEGIAGAIGINLLPQAGCLPPYKGEPSGTARNESQRMCLPDGTELAWDEYRIPGYSISICRYI